MSGSIAANTPYSGIEPPEQLEDPRLELLVQGERHPAPVRKKAVRPPGLQESVEIRGGEPVIERAPAGIGRGARGREKLVTVRGHDRRRQRPTGEQDNAGRHDPAEPLPARAPDHAFLARHTSASDPGENSDRAKSP